MVDVQNLFKKYHETYLNLHDVHSGIPVNVSIKLTMKSQINLHNTPTFVMLKTNWNLHENPFEFA